MLCTKLVVSIEDRCSTYFPLMLRKFLSLFFLFSFHFVLCQVKDRSSNLWNKNKLEQPLPYAELKIEKYTGPEPKLRNEKEVSALLIHITKGISARDFLELSWKNGWNVHFLIDKNGNLYGDPYAPIHIYPTAPGVDRSAIHIVLEGTAIEAIENSSQWKRLRDFTKILAKEFKIPRNNHDISSRRGIFTHNQSKKRFGGFIELNEYGEERVLEKLLKDLDGKYYSESQWKGRYNPEWVFRKENREAIRAKFKPNRGRGITPTPVAILKNLEKTEDGKILEARRLQYEYRGPIAPSCVVLHYTAISSFEISVKTLEDRNLTATIMVDTDGKAYQLLDSLEDKASAAYGTNDHCIQIEIVGKNTQELLQNKTQTQKVVEIVKELSKKYNFPLNNHKIESHRGVFSHTQAKKKFGGSSYLIGNDFDPGEEYMALVLNLAKGKYFPEKEWFERQSENWVILDREFQP